MKKLIRKEDVVMKVVSASLVDLPTPSSISYLWNFGSLLGVFLAFQLLTGMFLALHFSGDLDLSFSSVIHLMRDVNYGWIIRVLHSNGASLFFLFLYFHVGRGIFFGSYHNEKIWASGVTILLLAMATAFLGYVLPWGQMSFWAATVITNLLSAIPYVGKILVEWVWGGFAVSNPTLTRFFAFHFILPFVIMFMVIIHLAYLHESGSNNPLGLMSNVDKVSFHPYFLAKDVLGFLFAFLFLVILSLFWPYAFMDCENFIPSNPLVTPTHIQPEWYFLFAYSILRSISSKVGGVVALMMSVLVFYFFPFFTKSSGKNMAVNSLSRVLFWILVGIWGMLTWMGAQEVEPPFTEMGGVVSFLYFFVIFLIWVMIVFQESVLE